MHDKVERKRKFRSKQEKHKRKNFVRLLREEYNVQFMKGVF